MGYFKLDITVFKHAPWGGATGDADIFISTLDWSDAQYRMEVATAPGEDGTSLIMLDDADAGEEGLSSTYDADRIHPKTRAVVGGTMIRPQIDKATLEALAYAADPASDRVLYYDLHVTPAGEPERVLCYGRFIIRPGVTDDSGAGGGGGGGDTSDEDIMDLVAGMLTEGPGIDISYNDAEDELVISVDPSEIQATAEEMWQGDVETKVVTPKSIYDAAEPQVLTDGATVTPDFNAGLNFEWTIAGNHTLANPTNAKPGQSGTIKITQGSGGSHIVTYGSNWRFPGGQAVGGVLSTTAGAVDYIAYFVGNDGKLDCARSKAFAA